MANIDGHNNLQWYLEMDYDTERKEVTLHIFKILKCKKIWLFGALYKIQLQEYFTLFFNYNTDIYYESLNTKIEIKNLKQFIENLD